MDLFIKTVQKVSHCKKSDLIFLSKIKCSIYILIKPKLVYQCDISVVSDCSLTQLPQASLAVLSAVLYDHTDHL